MTAQSHAVRKKKAVDKRRQTVVREYEPEVVTNVIVRPDADGISRVVCTTQTKKTPENMRQFLMRIAAGDLPAVACAKIGLNYGTAYEWRREDEEFRKAWAYAQEIGTDLLEQEARRRAYDGVERPIYQGGELVGHEIVYSDSLMQFLLKGRRHTVFRDRAELSGPNGGPLEHRLANMPDLSEMSIDELTSLYREAVAPPERGGVKPKGDGD